MATTGDSKYAITSSSGVIERLTEILADINLRLVQAESRYDSSDRAAQEVAAQGIRYLETVIVPAATKVADLLRSLSDLFQTSSTSTVAISSDPVTFVIKSEDRSTFANLGYVIADAQNSNAGFGGPVVSYDEASGSLTIDPDYTWGSGTFSSWVLTGSPPISAIVAAAQPIIDVQLKATGDAITADAVTRIAAAQASAQSVLDNAIKTNVVQNLNGAQQKQAKSNIGALGISYAYLSQSTTLQPSDAGNLFLCSGGGVVVTLPAAQDMKSGSLIVLQCWNGGSTDVKLVGGGNIAFLGEGLSTVKMREGSTIFFFCTGTEWLAFGAHAPLKAVLNALEAQTFTIAQKRQLKANAGTEGQGYYGDLSTTGVLPATAIGKVVYSGGSAATITLPAMKAGENVKIFNASGFVKTIAVPSGATLWYGFAGNANGSYSMAPGVTATFECYSDDGSVFVFAGTSPNHVNADTPQIFNKSQRSILRRTQRQLGSQFYYNPTEQIQLTADAIGSMLYYDINGRTLFLPPFADTALGEQLYVFIRNNSQVTVKPSAGDTNQLIDGPVSGGASAVLKGPGLFTFITRDNCWQYTGSVQNPADLSGAAFTGGISAPALSIAGNNVFPSLAIGGVLASSGTGLDINSAKAYLDVSFVARGPRLFAAMKGSVNNGGTATDIVWNFICLDVTAGNFGVTSDGAGSSAIANYGATGVASCLIGHNALTIGNTYLLRITVYKTSNNNGNVFPRDMSIFGINS